MSSDTLFVPTNFKTCRPVINQFRIGVQRHFVLLRVNLDRSMQDVESNLFQKSSNGLKLLPAHYDTEVVSFHTSDHVSTHMYAVSRVPYTEPSQPSSPLVPVWKIGVDPPVGITVQVRSWQVQRCHFDRSVFAILVTMSCHHRVNQHVPSYTWSHGWGVIFGPELCIFVLAFLITRHIHLTFHSVDTVNVRGWH